jgi:hypothetical protein
MDSVIRAFPRLAFAVLLIFCLIAKANAQNPDSSLADELKDYFGRASPHELASDFIGLVAIVSGQMGTIYEALRRSDRRPPLALYHAYRNEDGTSRVIKITTFEELERFITAQRKVHALYVAEIRNRGYEKLKSVYQVTASAGCPSTFPASGEATAEMNEFLFKLSQQAKSYTGIIVQSSITFQDSYLPTLVGDITDGKISVRDPKSTCQIALVPR